MAASVSEVARPDGLLAGCGMESMVGNVEEALRMGHPFIRGANAGLWPGFQVNASTLIEVFRTA